VVYGATDRVLVVLQDCRNGLGSGASSPEPNYFFTFYGFSLQIWYRLVVSFTVLFSSHFPFFLIPKCVLYSPFLKGVRNWCVFFPSVSRAFWRTSILFFFFPTSYVGLFAIVHIIKKQKKLGDGLARFIIAPAPALWRRVKGDAI